MGAATAVRLYVMNNVMLNHQGQGLNWPTGHVTCCVNKADGDAESFKLIYE
jgi:hypothetical protein